MNIDIRNFGKVGHVNIAIEGLTVIAGMNGTGKSTVSRTLMAYFTLLRRMGAHIHDQRLRSVVEVLQDKLPLSGASPWRLRRMLSDPDEDSPDVLQREYWENPNFLHRVIKRAISPHRLLLTGEQRDIDSVVQKMFPAVRKLVLDVLNRKDADYEELIYRTKFNQIFKGQIIPLFNLDAVATLTVENQNERQSLSFSGENMPNYPIGCKSPFASVFYLEPISILDVIGDYDYEDLDDRYDSGSGRWAQVLRVDRYDKEVSLEKDRKITNARKVLDSIWAVMHGSLVNVEGDIKFKEDGIEQPIEVLNVASGVKSMAMLAKVVGNGSLREGDLLIADEPESNLHPEWQVRFAEFLVLLQKELGIKLLLNTHSPYFLKALETYSKKYELGNCAHYYFLREVAGGGTEGDEITDDLTVAYEAFYKPLAAIMEA